MPPDSLSRRQWLRSSAATLAALALARGVTRGEATAAPALPPPNTRPLARLALNENPFGPSPRAVDAIVAAISEIDRYAGADATLLTEQIALREGVPPAQIIIGQVEAALGLHLGLGGGSFLYAVPGYTDLVAAAAETGGKPVPIPLNARLEHDLEAISERIDAETTAVFIVNPHNPSGTVVDPRALESLVRRVGRRTWVIVDEAYLEFTDDFAARTAVRLVRAGLNVVVLRTFGKLYALPGLQIGYAVIPPQFVSVFKRFGLGSPLTLNRLSIAAASASLGDRDYPSVIREKVRRERSRIESALQELRLPQSGSAGNFVFFNSGRPHEAVAAAFLARGIEIARPFPPFDSWVRLAVGLPEENALVIRALREMFA
jgi:histidinol-phosphate aminotransferase